MTIVHEISANQKHHRLIVTLDGGTELRSERVKVGEPAKVFKYLAVIERLSGELQSRVYEVKAVEHEFNLEAV